MKAFSYQRAGSVEEAVAAVAAMPGARFIAGGTNLLDLMKLHIETPVHLVDVNRIGLDQIAPTPAGGLRIGALVRNTDLAADARVRRDYAVLSRAIVAGASGQLRNKATTAGNEPGARDGRDGGHGFLDGAGALVAEGLHARSPATSRMAATMLG